MGNTMNVRGKLAKARLKFLQANAVKTGKNMHMEFNYFELKDIVPQAIQIFDEVGLVHLVEFNKETEIASMTIYDVDNMEDAGICFALPLVEDPPKYNKEGKVISNPLQSLGSTITYLRRYLYMLALDVVEHDEIDANIGKPEKEEQKPEAKKTPATKKERKDIADKLTEKQYADEKQIKALKTLLNKLVKADKPANEDFVNTICIQTKGLTDVDINVYHEIYNNVVEMLAEYGVKVK